MKSQKFIVKLSDKEKYNDKFSKYIFELDQPNRMEFEAGQYTSFKVDDNGDRRSYSIASDPNNHHSFELLIDHSPKGVGINFFKNLEFGQEVDVLAPLGDFTFDFESKSDEIVFVATGSGIAPFRSMIIDLLHNKNEQRPITLYWGLRYVEDLFLEDEFQDLASSYKNFKFHPVLSRAIEEWSLCRGRVTDCLLVHKIPFGGDYYLCGGSQMIKDVDALLQKRGVKKDNIYFEKFY